jgi:O-antigen ligase
MLSKAKLIGAGFFVLPFLFLPGAFGEPIRTAKEMGLVVFAALLLAYWVKDRIHVLASLLILALTYNICATGFGLAQKEGVVFVLSALAVSYAVLRLDERERFVVLKFIALSGAIQAIYSVLQVTGLDPIFSWKQGETVFPVGFLGQPTLFGAFIAATATASLFVGIYWAAIACAVMGLLTTSSFTIASLLTGITAWAYLKQKYDVLKVIISGGLVSLGLEIYFHDHVLVRGILYAHNRFDVWKQAVQFTIQNAPLHGFGLGSFKAIYYKIQPEGISGQSGRYLQAHNDYVQVFFETGLIGASLAFVVVGLFLFKLLRNDLTDSQRAYGAVGLCLLVNSLGSFPLYLSPQGLLIAVCLVLVIGRDNTRLID